MLSILFARITIALRPVTISRRTALVVAILAATPSIPFAQDATRCRFICEVAWKVEPTITIENLANRHRVVTPDGITERVQRERVFEVVLALDMATKIPWLGLTAEAIASPFSDDNDVELEFESGFHWLTESMTGGWVTSHFDVVDQFSPAERPDVESRIHTNWISSSTPRCTCIQVAAGRSMAPGVEFETSLDYLATGIPKKGDLFPDGSLFLDDASHWSFSFVFMIPVAPF